MEDSTYTALKNSLSSVSANALNCSSYLILSNNLDYKQPLPSRNGYARDYRGLAELMGFQFNVIKKFGESENPTMKILDTWRTRKDAKLDKLIEYLEEMERHDVINELTPFLERNVQMYLKDQRALESPIQVPEVTPGPMNLHSERSALTRDDLRSGECTIYDAYVSYADEDCNIVAEFAKYLESPEVGLKLFIRGRDMLAGCAELDTNIELIKNRCKHMLILLTPNFIKSPALEFQVSFAGSLAIEQKQRILIPVILSPCEIPLILNSVSKIDFTKDHIQDWMWDKLITSLLPEESMNFFLSSFAKPSVSKNNMLTSPGCSTSSNSVPVITFPQTAKYSICSADNSGSVPAVTSADLSENEVKDSSSCIEMKDSVTCTEVKDSAIYTDTKVSASCVEVAVGASSSKPTSSSKKFSLMQFLKRKGNSSNASSSASFSSGATSGFHSQSCHDLKSFENADVTFPDDNTSL